MPISFAPISPGTKTSRRRRFRMPGRGKHVRFRLPGDVIPENKKSKRKDKPPPNPSMPMPEPIPHGRTASTDVYALNHPHSLSAPMQTATSASSAFSHHSHSRSHSNPTHHNPPTHHHHHRHQRTSSLTTQSQAQLHSSLIPGYASYDIRWTLTHSLPRASEPALKPTLRRMTLHSPYISASWDITVRPDYNKVYITVYDVLHTIHNHLRTQVTQSEYSSYSSSERITRRVAIAYQKRYRALGGAGSADRDREKRSGIRRVDFLMEHTKFIGLVPTSRPDIWTYQMAPV